VIYFATVRFSEDVHAQGLGFTRLFFPYVDADNPTEAEALIRAHYASPRAYAVVGPRGIPIVERVTMNPAKFQDLSRYTFPEQIIRRQTA
jgi:hypothetical protein